MFNSNLKASVIALGSGYTKSNTDQTVYMKGSYGIWVHHKKKRILQVGVRFISKTVKAPMAGVRKPGIST